MGCCFGAPGSRGRVHVFAVTLFLLRYVFIQSKYSASESRPDYFSLEMYIFRGCRLHQHRDSYILVNNTPTKTIE